MNNPEPYNESGENPYDELRMLDILSDMGRAGLSGKFIGQLMRYCQEYEGLQDLMEMWFEETNTEEKNKIVADLQDCLDDILDSPSKPEEKPYLHFDDLGKIEEDVLQFKKRLREEVDKQGGISELSRRMGVPQPSLSRFFNSASMPRRTTLYKIAKALRLSESEISFKWNR